MRLGVEQGLRARQGEDKAALVKEVAQALYASKICSYAQGMNIIRAKSMAQDWGIEMGSLARIWKARRCMEVHGGPHTFWSHFHVGYKGG